MSVRLALMALLCVGCASAKAMAPRGPLADQAALPQAGSDAPTEMLDIQAKVTLRVQKLPDAAAKLREIARSFDARMASDEVSADGMDRGVFDLRVPAARLDSFLTAIGGLGQTLARSVTAADVSKQFHDDELLLQNLRATLARYTELLSKATDVKDMLAIESELGRVRGEIERVEGERRWLADRVARASVHVELQPDQPNAPVVPEAKFYPGARFEEFSSIGTGQPARLGGGFSVLFGGRFSLDLDVLRKTGADSSDGADLVMATAAFATYSDFLGGGRRTFLNPYLGLRAGYARVDGGNAGALGLDLGVELLRHKYGVVEAQVTGLGLLGAPHGSSFGVLPSLTARVAF